MRRFASTLGTITAATAVALVGIAPRALGAGATRTDAQGEVIRYALPDGSPSPVAAGATARVHAVATPSGKTIVTLVVDGYPAERAFGSHVHKKACDATDPAASGGHYQAVPGAISSASEVWLDFVTDANGHGEATAVVGWHFAKDATHPDGANSVVVHRDTTAANGTAGPRITCLTVPFTG
jgi:Cu-Zn family superoxide dismutase